MQFMVNEPDRMVLRDRSLLMGVTLAAGATLAVTTMMGTAVWGLVDISTQQPLPTYYGLRVLLLLLVFVLGAGVAWASGTTAARVMQGVTCTFDRASEKVTIERPDGWHSTTDEHSLWGVSHALVQHSEETRTFALYLVLRSGERILIGACNEYEKETAERFVHNVKGFLRGR